MRRALAGLGAAAILATAGFTSCTVSKLGMGVNFTASITVPAHPSERTPRVRGLITGIITSAPRGGVMTMTMWYARTALGKWHFAGRASKGNPWHVGPFTIGPVWYPCLRSGLRWRLRVTWDVIAPDGTPVDGGGWYPNRFGKKLTC